MIVIYDNQLQKIRATHDDATESFGDIKKTLPNIFAT